MDRLEAMRLFTRVVDRRSFTQAAHDLGHPALDGDAGDPATGEPPRCAAAPAHDANGDADPRWRGLLPALSRHPRRRRGRRRRVQRRGAERHAAGRGAGHDRAALPDARTAPVLRKISRHRNRHERKRPLGRRGARRRRLRAALRRAARQRSRRAHGHDARAHHLRRAGLSRTLRLSADAGRSRAAIARWACARSHQARSRRSSSSTRKVLCASTCRRHSR